MQRLAQSHGVDPEIVPLGVDTDRLAPAPKPPGPPWRLLHVGSLNPVKDQSTLVRAFALLVARGLDVHLDVVGEDTLDGRIQELATRMGVDGRITFHGFLPTATLADMYRKSHVLLLSSRHEAAGVVVLEAAACGVPTVGTEVGYVSDWAPERAVAVAIGDAQALAAAAEQLLLDPERRQTIAHRARAWAIAHGADWTAAAFERIYTTLT
jgi:glycosyltransferase involved in cell wall biosynthesis